MHLGSLHSLCSATSRSINAELPHFVNWKKPAFRGPTRVAEVAEVKVEDSIAPFRE